MTEPVQVALVSFVVGPAILAVMSWMLTRRKIDRIDRNASITRDQVANDHDTNLREEQDSRHQDSTQLLEQIVATQAGQSKAIGGIRDTLRLLAEADLITVQRSSRLEARFDLFEDTIPRHEIPRPSFAPPPRHRLDPLP